MGMIMCNCAAENNLYFDDSGAKTDRFTPPDSVIVEEQSKLILPNFKVIFFSAELSEI